MTTRHDEAIRFLELLRARTNAAPGTDPAAIRAALDRFRRTSLIPEQQNDPETLAMMDRAVSQSQNRDELFDPVLRQLQGVIERVATETVKGIDLDPLRPVVGELRTGQVNAMSMRVPGPAGAYLVVFEGEMTLFASKLSKALAWTFPCSPGTEKDTSTFEFSVAAATRRIATEPEVAQRFANILIAYATTGSLATADYHPMPQGYFNFAGMLRDALEYFVLSHEYAHIILGHLEAAAVQKGILAVPDAEVMAWSWQQELAADWMRWT